jgi:hypothetical protein
MPAKTTAHEWNPRELGRAWRRGQRGRPRGVLGKGAPWLHATGIASLAAREQRRGHRDLRRPQALLDVAMPAPSTNPDHGWLPYERLSQ